MARKSAASLAVVAGSIDGRPPAPGTLTEAQQAVWDRTVANEAADVFKTAVLQQLLAEYCRHVASAANVSSLIDTIEAKNEMSSDDLADYERLLRMRDRETKAEGDKATKLRLTNQSRYTPQAAATAAKKGAERKPWQKAG